MQKRHRIFIAINLPPDIKKFLARFEQKWPDLPAKWTSQENLRITLVFLGDLTDIELGEVCMVVKEVAGHHASFNITLNRVGYGPDDKLPPRLLWASGEKNQSLSLLKTELQDSLMEKVSFAPELWVFSPHVTLARISTLAWRQINPEERPEVTETVDLTLTVESIEVMESKLKRGGPQYVIIESHSLM